MSPGNGTPRELRWASLAIAFAAVCIVIAQEKTRGKLRGAREEAAAAERACERQFERLSGLRMALKEQLLKTEELHFELDGPWEDDVDGGKTETPADGKTALEEPIDPESRRPEGS